MLPAPKPTLPTLHVTYKDFGRLWLIASTQFSRRFANPNAWQFHNRTQRLPCSIVGLRNRLVSVGRTCEYDQMQQIRPNRNHALDPTLANHSQNQRNNHRPPMVAGERAMPVHSVRDTRRCRGRYFVCPLGLFWVCLWFTGDCRQQSNRHSLSHRTVLCALIPNRVGKGGV